MSVGFFKSTKYKEIAIKIYKIVQTGANTKFGGVKIGLFKSSYHVEIEERVKKDAKNPVDKQITREIKRSFGFFTTKPVYQNSKLDFCKNLSR